MAYGRKVRLVKTRFGRFLWKRYRRVRGQLVERAGTLEDLITRFAPGRRFVDVGCMWDVNGRYTFLAEEVGAVSARGVDVMEPTPEFENERVRRASRVEFIRGDILAREALEQIGAHDVVFCAGVLYHHPSPYELLLRLRDICEQTLILRTSTVPENSRLPNMAVFWPHLSASQRRLWSKAGGRQLGIDNAFDAADGYGNWFWGFSPTCLRSVLRVVGFEVIEEYYAAMAITVVCRAAHPPLRSVEPEEETKRHLDVRPDQVVQFGEPSSGRPLGEGAVWALEVVAP